MAPEAVPEHQHPLIAIVGPTGSGKSELALELATQIGGEIVNCDSVQLYRYLNIGAAKTPVEERRGVPHHLIDILNPDEHFTAGDYARLARSTVAEIAGRQRIPVLAGGTGFYLRAFLNGLSESPSRDAALRERLARRSPAALHRLLRRFDPAAAARIHPNDGNKLLRAVEICLLTRRPVTQFFGERPSRALEGFRVLKIGLDPPRSQLAERINQRCERMFRAGLIEEVRGILSLGFSSESKALQSIGYREAVLCIQGVLSVEQALFNTQAATRQYAKRQRTWFRREPEMVWIREFGQAGSSMSEVVHHLKVDINFS